MVSMRGAAGTGSTVAVLVFSVLCLTIFSMIALLSASADKSLAEAAASTVVGYYEADMLAELIIADITEYTEIPGNIRGIAILNEGGTVSFACPVSDNKELYVEIELLEDSHSMGASLDINDGIKESRASDNSTFPELKDISKTRNCYITEWRMRRTQAWENDGSLPVWSGEQP